jgi:hypothetical protein
MRRKTRFGLTAAEKLIGLLLLLIGGLYTYLTLTSSQALGSFTGFFMFLSISILILGLFLIVAKIE